MTAYNHRGHTARIIVSVVREDVHHDPADTPERLLDFWLRIIAEQPDNEPDNYSFREAGVMP